MIKWVPSASTKSDNMVVPRGEPLGYCQEKPDYSVPAPDFVVDLDTSHTLPFTEVGGCVSVELNSRLDHNHLQFREDSATLFDKMKECFIGTSYHSMVKPFKKNKDGYGLWN